MRAIEKLVDDSGSQPLWRCQPTFSRTIGVESAAKLAHLVQLVLQALRKKSSLPEDWASEALRWAVSDSSELPMARY